MKKVLVTGGCGFIGSHLVDVLMRKEAHVHVIDNLSTGTIQNLKQWVTNSRFRFVKGDLLDTQALISLGGEFDYIFHLAANPEVRVSSTDPQIHFQQNVITTYNLLEYLREKRKGFTISFASTSAIYGEPRIIPNPETYAPFQIFLLDSVQST